MENQIPNSELSTAARDMLKSLFWNKVRSFDNTTKTDYRMSKQQQIRQLGSMIERIIMTNRYAFFEIGVLEHGCDDVDNLDYGIIIKNFEDFLPNTNPDKYRIIINEAWNGFSIWQRSLDDAYWTKLPKTHNLE